MSIENIHFRHAILHEFRHGKKATKATDPICSVSGVDALNVRVCQKWFAAEILILRTKNVQTRPQ